MSATIANTILQQLGGNQFIAMTGSSKFIAVDGGNTLLMKLVLNKSGCNVLRVTLDADDTYTMVFQYEQVTPIKKLVFNPDLPRLKVSKQQEFNGVYCDQLKDIFEEVTGLFVTLHKRG
jgi:hypothetical protein